jgi:hypothetical protein
LLAAGLWLLASDTLLKFREEANKIIMIFFWFDVSNKSTANNFDKVEAGF